MSKLTKALTAAAGNAGGDPLYAEDVFSTYLYDGTGAAHTITNGIDLDGEGGLTWIKTRNTGTSAWHSLSDTERGAGYILRSDLTNAQNFDTAEFTSFNSDGFTVGNDAQTNGSGRTYASWTFRKAEKFFDVQTWTGNSTAGRTVAHNLGSAPKFVIVKRTDTANNWVCWHSGIAITKYLQINSTSPAYNDGGIFWDSTLPDASNITLGSDSGVNATGSTYVAYLFASDAGGFGDDGSENVIKCGSVTTDGSGDATVTLGFEPQWVMLKRTDGAGAWAILDTMRGYDHSSSKRLMPNVADAEENYTGTNILGVPTATGFTTSGPVLDANSDYIYIAIRRPMKTPTAGTEVFAMDTLGSTGDGNQPGYRSPFPVDMGLKTSLTGNQRQISTRLLQGTELLTESTAAEAASASKQFDYMNGTDTSTATSSVNMMWMFKRATGFMDAVAYSGSGSGYTSPKHNLSVAPEMIWVKRRNNTDNWRVLNPNNKMIVLNNEGTESSAGVAAYYFGDDVNVIPPTSTEFTVHGPINYAESYIAYLFATLAGVSKVGSYTGTAATLNVDCGFSAGARFILIKRTDATGDWYVYDSLRGIVAGNDPYFFLNNTAAQVTNTDYIDPLASGFTVTSSAPAALNASGGNYIFLAIS